MPDNPSKNGTAQVVEYPVSDEEKARRFHAEVVRMAAQPESYWLFLIGTDHVQKFGATKEQFEQAIRAVLAEQEKRERTEKAEQRRIEDRAEKKQEREVKHTRQDEARVRRETERARKETERLEREQEERRKKRDAAFAAIADLPKPTHEVRLREAAARLGEDLEILTEEFEVLLAAREIPEELAPWPEPVRCEVSPLRSCERRHCHRVHAVGGLYVRGRDRDARPQADLHLP